MNEPNWANRTIWTGDNLPIMRGMNSESVDLIYLDPPFNSKANYAAPIGSVAAGAEFKDTWTLTDIDEAWLYLLADKPQQKPLWRVIQAAQSGSDKSYLIYMAIRLQEMKRLLKSTGSIYLHCDPTMSHYLKLLLDVIFGQKNFRNEIHWYYYNKMHDRRKKLFAAATDTIFFYVKDSGASFHFRQLKELREKPVKQLVRKKVDGRMVNARDELGKLIYQTKSDRTIDNVWRIPCLQPASQEKLGYPTQKPLALLERIIKTSSNEGDLVFDPFCGCATTLVAADRLNREWIGIDVSDVAVELVKERIKIDQGLFNEIIPRSDIPKRTDLGKLPLYKSLANKKYLYGEQGGNCNGCQKHFEIVNFHVDHIIAQSQGGTDHIENLQLLCGYCNSVKGNRGMEYLKAKLGL